MAFDLTPLSTEITEATTVMGSAKALIDGIAQRITDAVAQATANGATAAELQPVVDLGTALKAGSDALQASVAANTVAAPEVASRRR